MKEAVKSLLEREPSDLKVSERSNQSTSNNSNSRRVSIDGKSGNDNRHPRSPKPCSRQPSTKRRLSLPHTKHVISTKDIRTAFMLFVVSILYIAFIMPSITTTYLTLLLPNFTGNLYITYLYFSNSAINPMIYCFLNPIFRSDLLKLFFKRGFIFDKCAKQANLK